MKLTAFFLLVFALHLSAKTSSQTITFSGTNAGLEDVFRIIKKQTGYSVFYNDKILDQAMPVTITADNMPLEKFLEVIFRQQQGLNFSIKQTSIVVSRELKTIKAAPPAYDPILVYEAPGRDVSGFIYDIKSAAPLRGVTINVNGTNKATQTDENGKFILKGVEDNITITITCVGYEKQVMKLNKEQSSVYIALTVATSELDQAVVQAYGITSKRMATGNITKVSGDDIRKSPVMNPLQALAGRVPGLSVTMLTGHASSPIKMVIRGRNNLNPNALSDPLYVIDGIPQTVLELPGNPEYNAGVSSGNVQAGIVSFTRGQSPLFNINPMDIESIEVLKDGDATAIYGSRAANGVILITTKKGKPGRTNFEMNVEQGMMMTPFKQKMLSLSEYLAVRREAFRNDGITPSSSNALDLKVWDTTRSTDWVKELNGVGKRSKYTGILSGGDLRTSFRLSASYTDQVDLNSRSGGNKQGTFQLSVNHTSINEKLSAGLMVSYATSKVDAIADAAAGFMTSPNAPPIFNEQGNLNFAPWQAGSQNAFPFAYILRPNINKTNSLNSSLSINYVLMKGLTLTGAIRFSSMQGDNNWFLPIAANDPASYSLGTAFFGNSRNTNIAFEPQVQYNRTIGKGRLSVLTGATLQNTNTRGITTTAIGYTNDDLIKSMSNAMMTQSVEKYSEYKYAALFARINYNWDSKYILNLNGRRDGSSRFAPGRQFGNFGSVGAAWIASEEEWLKNALPSWFSFVKLRGNMALTGNDAIGEYEYLSRYANSLNGAGSPLPLYNNVQPYVPIVPLNQQYRWEELKSIEGAVNLGFLDDRLLLDLAWYRKRSSNQLTMLPTPQYSGFEFVRANWTAKVQNSGVEAMLNAIIIKKKDVQFSVGINISRNVNKLISYPDLEKSPYANQYKVGQSLNVQYFLHYIGVNPQTGDYVYEDYSKDGRVMENLNVTPGTKDDDRYVMVDMNPKFEGGITPSLTLKQWHFSMNFSYGSKKGFHPSLGVVPGSMQNFILTDDMEKNHWRKPGDNAKYARYTTSGGGYSSSDLGLVDASFLRLNTVACSYRLPDRISKKAGLQSCNFSVQAQNVFIISATRMDPDIQRGSFVPVPRVIQGVISFTL